MAKKILVHKKQWYVTRSPSNGSYYITKEPAGYFTIIKSDLTFDVANKLKYMLNKLYGYCWAL